MFPYFATRWCRCSAAVSPRTCHPISTRLRSGHTVACWEVARTSRWCSLVAVAVARPRVSDTHYNTCRWPLAPWGVSSRVSDNRSCSIIIVLVVVFFYKLFLCIQVHTRHIDCVLSDARNNYFCTLCFLTGENCVIFRCPKTVIVVVLRFHANGRFWNIKFCCCLVFSTILRTNFQL